MKGTPERSKHMAAALNTGGLLAIYGPFKRGDAFVSAGDERFDAAIRAERPQAGYKDVEWAEGEIAGQGLAFIAREPMPANNLLLLWRKPE